MWRKLIVPLSLAVVLSAACSPLPTDRSPLPTATSPATRPPASTATSTPMLISTSTAVPRSTATPIGSTPPAGLIYRTADGIWQIQADGHSRRVFDYVWDIAVSPAADQLLYVQDTPSRDALWLVDVTTGQRRQIIADFEGTLCCPVWWPARPDWILFGSWARNREAPDAGRLTAARLDGKEYRVLDAANESIGLPAPAPDGRTIAYDAAGAAMLYDWENGPKVFDPRQYGLANIQRIGSPAWSPDGRQLAWYAGGDFGQGWQVGVAVFDLAAHTAQLIHLYTNVGRGGWFDAPRWSADGRWLAFVSEDEQPDRQGLWVVSMTGERRVEQHLGLGRYQWSPDGAKLVVGRSLVEVGTWQSQPLALLPDAEVIGWAAPSE